MSAQMPPLMLSVLTPQTKSDTLNVSFIAFIRAHDDILVGSVLDMYLPQETVIPKGRGGFALFSVYS